MIPENYVKLELPTSTLQVVGQTSESTPVYMMDGLFYTATL